MRLKVYLLLLLLLSAFLPVKATRQVGDLIGKVYGEFVRQVPPYDVELVPLSGSNLTIKEMHGKGWLTDSTGCFRIEGLKAGTFHLKAEYVGLQACDTVVTLPSSSSDTLRLTLPLWYDYLLKYDCSPELSQANVRKGRPKVRLIIPEKQAKEIWKHPFWKKYGVSYDISYPLQEDGKLDCYLSVPAHLLAAYNQVVFDWLDGKYGKSWRKEVPEGVFIFGLEKAD